MLKTKTSLRGAEDGVSRAAPLDDQAVGRHAQHIVVAQAGVQAGGALCLDFQLPSQSVRTEALSRKRWGGVFGEGRELGGREGVGPVALRQGGEVVRSGSGAGLASRGWLTGSCQPRVQDLPSHPPCLSPGVAPGRLQP